MAPINMDNMRDIFVICQSRPNAFAKGISELLKIYNSRDHDEFFAELRTLLQVIFPDSEKTVCAERLIDFTAQFVASPELVTKSDDAPPQNKLLTDVLTTALEWSECANRLIRQRSCELVGRIQHHLKDESVIDDELFENMEAKMMNRLSDTIAGVRAKAAGALVRLQEPANSKCRIVEVFLFHLNNDPNPEVRSAILKAVVPSNRSLEAILSRARDVKEGIRKLALECVTNRVPIRYLSIKQRMTLLVDGLNDRSLPVQKVVSEKLLPAWLTQCGESPMALLRMLDCHGSEETIEKVLKLLFEKLDMKEVAEAFKTECLNETRVIPSDKLTCEGAMYWKHLALFLKSKQEADADLQLESIFPELVTYSSYVCDFVLSLDEDSDTLKKLEHCFISQQLIGLATVADMSDNAGRAMLAQSMQQLFQSPKVGSLIVPQLVKTMRMIHPEKDKMLQEIMSMVAEIQAPWMTSFLAVNEDQSQPWDVQVARMKVELNIMREELAEAINEEDFAKAIDVKERIQEAEGILKEKRQEMGELPDTDDASCSTDSDPDVVLKCLTVIAEMLENTVFTSLPPILDTCIYEMILPRISMEDVAVRKQATRVLALCCILNKQVAVRHIRLLLEIALVDHPPIQVVALSGVFDLVLSFGAEAFVTIFKNIVDGQDGDEEDSCDAWSLDPLVSFFVRFLDAEDGDVRTAAAEGLSMLQIYGHIYSPSLLSRLILLWYNPSTDPNSLFRQTLGAFMAAYSSAGQTAARCFEEAFLVTLKTLFSAPPSSPLSQIDPLEVVAFLVDVTLPRAAVEDTEASKPTEQTSHDRLAEELCNEVLKNPYASDIHVLLKALSLLQITENASFKELQVAARQMEKRVREKRSLALVNKFASKVRLTPQQEDDDDTGTSVTIDSVTTTSTRSVRRAPRLIQQQEVLSSQDLFPSSPEM
ncbi:condensin complex subunit 3-like [Ornithodoros turicata]|uniref:condensin complex subunit 3-like n=1 Tax=Ornithodoros turicata TaxID=34597 RepID=UPI0031387BAD